MASQEIRRANGVEVPLLRTEEDSEGHEPAPIILDRLGFEAEVTDRSGRTVPSALPQTPRVAFAGTSTGRVSHGKSKKFSVREMTNTAGIGALVGLMFAPMIGSPLVPSLVLIALFATVAAGLNALWQLFFKKKH